MPKKKPVNKKQPTLNVGTISDVSGNVNVAGGNITTHQTIVDTSTTELKRLFDHIYNAIEQLPKTSSADKEDVKTEVKEIQSTVTEAAQNKTRVDEGFLSRHFRNIARISPDVLEVIVATLGSPLAGLGVAAKKIAEKAKEETT